MLVLDANVVRNLVEGDVSPSPFEAWVADGGTVHIADGALVEILAALHEGRLPWTAWAQSRMTLGRLVSEHEPALMGGRELLRDIGLDLSAPPSTLEAHDHRELIRDVWQRLRNAESVESLRELVRPATGGRQLVILNMGAAGAQLDGSKERWPDQFERYREAAASDGVEIPGRLVPDALLEHHVAALKANVDARTASVPPASTRLDGMIRVHILHSLRSVKRREPYNASKNSNDRIDLELYRYLAKPAAVCTSDERVHSLLRDARSWQASWVVRPGELLDPKRRRALLELAWPRPPLPGSGPRTP